MKLLKALLAQVVGWGIAVLSFEWFPACFPGVWYIVCVQAVSASVCAALLRQPWWWSFIHLLFFPAALALLVLQWSPWFHLLAFVSLVLIFWKTAGGDVPLFLSSTTVPVALERALTRERAQRFAELGAGIGSVAVPLAQRQPQLAVAALEHAPLPWLSLRWRSRNLPNVGVYRQNFWEWNLMPFDVVFAFLSPAVMPALSRKARREMRPGSLLISSSFPITDWSAERVEYLDDRRATVLFYYRIPASSPRSENV